MPACLESALKQGDAVEEILVYDDHSVDGTAGIISGYAGKAHRVRAIEPVALDSGWCGKNFACSQPAAASNGDLILFLDADARLKEGGVERMVEEMDRRNLQFLSCWPDLEMLGFWERALMPLLNFTVSTLFPAPLSIVRNDPSLCGCIHRSTASGEAFRKTFSRRSGARPASGRSSLSTSPYFFCHLFC